MLGRRRLMGLALAAHSLVQTPLQFYAVWLTLGAGMLYLGDDSQLIGVAHSDGGSNAGAVAGGAVGTAVGADQSNRAVWEQLTLERDYLLDRYETRIDVVPINYDSLVAEGSADMVLMSRKMAVFMRAGTLDKILAASRAALKTGALSGMHATYLHNKPAPLAYLLETLTCVLSSAPAELHDG